MADEDLDGLLSQDDINAALAAAGLPSGSEDAAAGDSSPSDETGSSVSVETRVDSAGRPFDEVASAMAAAIEAETKSGPVPVATAPPPSAFSIPELASVGGISTSDIQGIDLLRDVKLDVKIELGRSRMLVDDVLRLGEGSIVELDKLAGDPVDVLVNGRLVARGEVLVLNDNFCVRINDILAKDHEEELKR